MDTKQSLSELIAKAIAESFPQAKICPPRLTSRAFWKSP